MRYYIFGIISSSMKIMKFGGSSVRNAEMIRRATAIILDAAVTERVVVVLSAMKGVTDGLIGTAHAAADAAAYRPMIDSIEARHYEAVEELLRDDQDHLARVRTAIVEMFSAVRELLHGVALVRECTARTLDLIAGYGERLSCTIVAAYLSAARHAAVYVDARELIVTDELHGAATVEIETTYERIVARLAEEPKIPVVTGFIAATRAGVTTTLGRNGSDYTASILGAALSASGIEIWTDVDGVLSADPRYVPNAFVIPEVSYQEAMEMSYFGAEVIHPYTMIPAVEKAIPLRIKNTSRPDAPGTIISDRPTPNDRPITGLASIENVALVNVEGGGMVGIPGIASRVFSALGHAGINVIMISQASSEHSICIVFRRTQARAALDGLRRELQYELATRKIQQFEIRDNLEIVAVIGDGMRGAPGISGRIFSALGNAEINVLAIAQGSSEINVSFVVDGADREIALNSVHTAFFGEKDS